MARTRQIAENVNKRSRAEWDNKPKIPLTVALPSELLLYITNFIPHSELCSVQLTCKAFYNVVRDSVRNVRPQITKMLFSISKYLSENKFRTEENESVIKTLHSVIKNEQDKLEAR